MHLSISPQASRVKSARISEFLDGMVQDGFLQPLGEKRKLDARSTDGGRIGNRTREPFLLNWHNTDPSRKQVEEFLRPSSRPWFAVCEVTYSCNLRCVTCYANGYEAAQAAKHCSMLSIREYKEIVIDQLAEHGVYHVTFMGGEPFMRPGFLDIVEHARKRNLFVKIQSNGTRIGRGDVARMKDIGVQQVEISLDGIDAETNDRIRGKGSLARALRALHW
ncbi:MAG: radical SAM protein, partial [Desulfobacteraceae bacterium]